MNWIVIFLLAVFVLDSVQNELTDSDYAPENFGDLFRGGLGGLTDLFQRNRDGDQEKDNGEAGPSFKNFCGCRLGASSRIIGGKEAAKDSIPWHVSLGAPSGKHLCGGKFNILIKSIFDIGQLKTIRLSHLIGAIVNENTVVTALHCVAFLPTSFVYVRVGATDLRDVKSSNIHAIQKVIGYSRLVNMAVPSDLAILKLRTPIKFRKGSIEPACFNLNQKAYTGQLMGSGYGMTTKFKTRFGFPATYVRPSDKLKQAQFRERRCLPFLICTRPVNSRDSACMGDSGSPIHDTPINGKTSVEGVLSFVTGRRILGSATRVWCNGAAGYSKIASSAYRNWFKKTVGEDSFCKA